jgi:nucleoside-diphosphate-sugar epimerase
MLHELGAVPVVADALDPDQVAQAVGRAKPDVIVHQLTAIPATLDLRHFDRDFALTNRLRTEGTDHLLSAGQAVGVRRFVAQSYGAWPYMRTGGPVKSEEDPLDPAPAREMRRSAAAIRHLEQAVLGARWTEGVVLRYGSSTDQAHRWRRARLRPSWSASASSRWSATVAACGPSSTSPTPRRRRWRRSSAAAAASTTSSTTTPPRSPSGCRRWLEELGAKKPVRVPRFIGRLFAGEAGVVMMTEVRGASNAKAKRELGWRPAHPSWRQGFAAA